MTKLLLTIRNTDSEGFTIDNSFIYKSIQPIEPAKNEVFRILEDKGLTFEELIITDLDSIPELD
jgi:hypothetical protein